MKCDNCKKKIKGVSYLIPQIDKLQFEVEDLIYCEKCYNELIKYNK